MLSTFVKSFAGDSSGSIGGVAVWSNAVNILKPDGKAVVNLR